MNTALQRLVMLCTAALLGSACNAYGPKPTAVGTLTPRPTLSPAVTVGPLTNLTTMGVTLAVPTDWKVAASGDSFVISASGLPDTSTTAGPFLFVIPDAANALPKRTAFTFRPEISDSVRQLNALLESMQRDGPRFSPAQQYSTAKYPGAITTGFERDNQLTLVLLNAGNNRWIYVGTQSPERYFSYYNEHVFTPAINALVVQ